MSETDDKPQPARVRDDSGTGTGTGTGPSRRRLAGMALGNGLLIYGPTCWAVAVERDGERTVMSGKRPVVRGRWARLPGLRGLAKLAEAIVLVPIVRYRVRAARLSFESPRVAVTAALSSTVTGWMRRRIKPSVARETAIAAVGLGTASYALSRTDVVAWHGAEHKVIGAWEQGVDDPESVSKEHPRCGSNLVGPMAIASLGGTALLASVDPDAGPLTRTIVSLAGVSLAVEVFSWADRRPDTVLAKAIRLPGYEIQKRLLTREPTADQLETAGAALQELLRKEPASPEADEPAIT